MPPMPPPALDTLAVLLPLPAPTLAKLRSSFKVVHYFPDQVIPPQPALRESITYIFTSNKGVPNVKLSEFKQLRHIQLASAGIDGASRGGVLAELKERAQARAAAAKAAKAGQEEQGARDPTLSTASGIHVISIPPWVAANVVNLYQQIQVMISFAREKKRWASEAEIDYARGPYHARSLRGKTAGMLGYGALGRETARLLKAFGMDIIAANTSGKSTSETEYIIPGTSDPDGSLPSAYYSTRNAESFDAFLRRTDVLVCSLPSTPATRYMLNASHLAKLKPEALFVNVGRGDLIRSEDLIEALGGPAAGSGSGSGAGAGAGTGVESRANGVHDVDGSITGTSTPISNPRKILYGAALDVTDPEPLPEGHPLYTHPRVVVTPHLSGNAEAEYDLATDIALENVKRLREGLEPFNVVDFVKGY